MQRILERFVTIARAHGSVPILLLIPQPSHLDSVPYLDFLARLRASMSDVTIVDIAKEPLDPRRFAITPQGGHPSLYGNRIIAGAVYRAIERIMQEDRAKVAGTARRQDGE